MLYDQFIWTDDGYKCRGHYSNDQMKFEVVNGFLFKTNAYCISMHYISALEGLWQEYWQARFAPKESKQKKTKLGLNMRRIPTAVLKQSQAANSQNKLQS